MKFSYRVVFSLEQLLTLDEEEALRFTCQKLNLGNTQLSRVKKTRTRTGPGVRLGLGPDVLDKYYLSKDEVEKTPSCLGKKPRTQTWHRTDDQKGQ